MMESIWSDEGEDKFVARFGRFFGPDSPFFNWNHATAGFVIIGIPNKKQEMEGGSHVLKGNDRNGGCADKNVKLKHFLAFCLQVRRSLQVDLDSLFPDEDS
jgi:hypothetical protein